MVANSIETNGTVNNITFKMVKIPLDELSSKLNEPQDNMAKIKVYANTILFFRISESMIFIILFIFYFALKFVQWL